MECAAAFISVALADFFILGGKDEGRETKLSVDVNASKSVPSDVNWSPVTATTMDDEMSILSDDEEDHFVSPKQSKVILMGEFIDNRSNRLHSDTSYKPEFDAARSVVATSNKITAINFQPPLKFQSDEISSVRRKTKKLSSKLRKQLKTSKTDCVNEYHGDKGERNSTRVHIQEAKGQKRLSRMGMPYTIPNKTLSSSSRSKEWQEKQYAGSMRFASAAIRDSKHNFSTRVLRTKTSTGELQAKFSRNTQNDFRSILSFWESMANHSPQRTGDSQGERARGNASRGKAPPTAAIKAKTNQHKSLETTSATYIQCCFRQYLRRRLERFAAIRIQKQARVFFAINEVSRIREAERESRSRGVALNGKKKIHAFVKHFSGASYGCPVVKDAITRTIPLATEKMSLFASNPATNEATRSSCRTIGGTNAITNGIRQEDFWRTQRVMLQHR
ncbi:unnamed protein product [Cylindrotheca closterium]|uniref:Uncharacterized protein n=1 Tax=Cylindrotheca closterium TaxID=2856 RepID=A0AAD2FX14_9STRA|nr:unnamed protein product [Cylindrotheca closterium]